MYITLVTSIPSTISVSASRQIYDLSFMHSVVYTVVFLKEPLIYIIGQISPVSYMYSLLERAWVLVVIDGNSW